MAEPVLALSGITKHFGGLAANEGVNLTLHAGEIHALIGPNGAGKSTLIAQICGELKPDAGTIRFAGRDITGLPTAQRARLGLARTFQISALANEFSALKNVVLAIAARRGQVFRFFRAAMKDPLLLDQAMATLERAGLAERAKTRVSDLAHGERRQLEIAIALALAPQAFVMDEPMAGMGLEGSRSLTGLLDGLRHEAPVLLVEHDMDAVFALADRISVMVYGRIIATGTVDEIRANGDVRAAYLGGEAA